MGPMSAQQAITLAEHYAVPDDGRRHELVDGVLVVSPAPSRRHAYAATRLAAVLQRSCPSDLAVLASPTNVDEEPATNLQPDLAVVRMTDLDTPTTTSRPLLVVEVLSPTTQRVDAVLKREVYARMGVSSFWLLDPDAGTLTVLELDHGGYAESAHAGREGSVTLQRPFPVTVVLADVLPPLP